MVTQGVRALCLTMLLSGISASAQRLTTRRAHVDDQTKMTRIISCAEKGGERLKGFERSEGFEGSKGIILQEGDTLIAPSNSALIKSMKLYLNFVKPDDVEWDYYSCLNIQGYDPKYNQWIDGGVWCEDLQDYVPDVFDCERDFVDFNNWLQVVRLIPETMPEGSYVVVDNIEIVTNQPFDFPLHHLSSNG